MTVLLVLSLFIIFWVIGFKIFAPTRVVEYKALCRGLIHFAITAIVFVVAFVTIANMSYSTNVDEYEMLSLYKEAVECSDNEYLRFDYYERVNKWNKFYKDYEEFTGNFWLAPPFMPDLSQDAGLIHFFLRQG